MMTTPRLIASRSVGTFDPKAWLQEGDGLLASAKVNRELWQRRRLAFSRTIRNSTIKPRERAKRWDELVGLPRASMLLLGYAVEMFLKAGLAKAYRGCAEKMFQLDVKSLFGHELAKIAEEIAFPFKPDDQAHFKLLKEMLLFDARYPVTVDDPSTYTDAVNQRTSDIWNRDKFRSLLDFALRVRAHAARIDNDKKNPSYVTTVKVDGDGYVTLRIGGHLPPRITYRPSSIQKKSGDTSLKSMVALFSGNKRFTRINAYWDKAVIYENLPNRKSVKRYTAL